jgi:hypothetical protein
MSSREFVLTYQLPNDDEIDVRDHDFAWSFFRALEAAGAPYAAAQTRASLTGESGTWKRDSMLVEVHQTELAAVGRASRSMKDEEPNGFCDRWYLLTELQDLNKDE